MQIAVLSSEPKCCKMEIRKLGGGIMSFEFKEIAGYEREKRELVRLCEVIKDRDKYARRGGRVPKGIIFYGATGMGKTMFAREMANACGLRIVRIDAGKITNGHALCKRIRRAFSLRSKRKGPAMILFDEIDKVLPNRREEYCTDQSKMILTQLLTLIDGLDCGGNFVFVATCNDYMALPRALVRPGRIDKKICLGMPTLSSRTAILDKYISETECRFEEPTAEIAKLCTGFSCATLKTFVNECVFYSDENAVISARAVRNCIAEIRNENLIRDVSAKTAYINACHNLGCFLVARSFQNGPYVIDLKPDTVCNDFFNAIIHDYDDDYDDYDDDFDDDYNNCEDGDSFSAAEKPERLYNKEDCIHAICALLGGYVAEKELLYHVYDNVSRSLWTADNVLIGMSESGLLGLGLRFSKSRENDLPYSYEHVAMINDELNSILADCYNHAQEIICANISLLEKLIPVLVEKRSLGREEGERLLEEFGGIRAVKS